MSEQSRGRVERLRGWLVASAPHMAIAGLATGAVGALGLPGIGLWPLGLAALLALDWYSQSAARASTAAWFGLGWALGFNIPYYLGTITWGPEVLATFWSLRSLLYVAPRIAAARTLGRRAPRRIVLPMTVAAWMLWLTLLERLGYPNYVSAYVLVDVTPLTAAGRWLGGALLDGVLAGASMTMARHLASRRWARSAAIAAGAAAALALISGAAARSAPDSQRTVTVGVPQVNVSSVYYRSRVIAPSMRANFEERLHRLLEPLRDVELLVTTESFDGRFHLVFPELRQRWAAQAQFLHGAVLLASYLPERNGRKSNIVAGYGPDGALVGVHRKVYLAPFGEATLTPGDAAVALDVLPGVRVGPLICLESILRAASRSQVENGANLLVASTSDITFRSTPLPFIHLAATRIRALEEGRSIIWASNGGPSGSIDRWGRFHEAAPFRRAASARFETELHDEAPPFASLEAWWLLLCAAIVAAGTVWFVRSPARDAPPAIEAPRARSRLRAVVAYALVALASLGSILVTPAWVEIANGRADRALDAIVDLWTDPPLPVSDPRIAWGTFQTVPAESAAGAVSYFLALYGYYVPVAELLQQQPVSTLEEIGARLEKLYGVRTATIPAVPPPVLPALVQLTDGTFAVTHNFSQADPTLFEPSAGPPRRVPTAAYEQSLKSPTGLLPVFE